jgi:proteic killer suppression protein
MIQSVTGKLAEQVLEGRPGKGFPANIFKVATRKFSMLDSAEDLQDLMAPPANRLEALKGDRAGQYSIRINDQWRICFVWTPLGPSDVEIVDYH